MKILKKDMKHGRVQVAVQNADDLWYLEQIIAAGDKVEGKTTRKIKLGDEKEKGDVVKRTVTLAIAAEDVAFQGTVLRVSGKIAEGTEDIPSGAYHSLSVSEGDIISITKEKWDTYQLRRLEESAAAQPKVLMAVFDREHAVFALMRAQGYEVLAEIQGDVQKKGDAGAKGEDFYQRIIAALQEYNERHKPEKIIIASPAFWKEELVKKVKDGMLKKKLIPATCSSVGVNGMEEVLKRKEVAAVLQEARAAQESVKVEAVMAAIARNGLVAYGMNEVEAAVGSGAAENLLVTTKLIATAREQHTFPRLEKIMKNAASMKGSVVIVNAANEAGARLDGIGGIASLLRYRILD